MQAKNFSPTKKIMVHGGGVVKWGLGVAARGMLGPVRITASKQVGKEGVNPLVVRVVSVLI